jgi:hypothetical protein
MGSVGYKELAITLPWWTYPSTGSLYLKNRTCVSADRPQLVLLTKRQL